MQTQARNPNLYCSPASGGNDNLKFAWLNQHRSLMAWELLCSVGLVVWPWKLRVSLHGSQIPGHSCPHLRWEGSTESHPDIGRADELSARNALFSDCSEHDEIRCRHLPYRHVKLQETNPRCAHLYQLFAWQGLGLPLPPTLCLEQATALSLDFWNVPI